MTSKVLLNKPKLDHSLFCRSASAYVCIIDVGENRQGTERKILYRLVEAWNKLAAALYAYCSSWYVL